MIRYSSSKNKTSGLVGKAFYLDSKEKSNYIYRISPNDFFNLNYTLSPETIRYLSRYFNVKVTDEEIKRYTKTNTLGRPIKAVERLDMLFGDLWQERLYKIAKKAGYSYHSDSSPYGREYAVKSEEYKTSDRFRQQLNKGVNVGRRLHFGRISTTINTIEKDFKLLTKKGNISASFVDKLKIIEKDENIPLAKSQIVKGVNKQADISQAKARQSLEQGLRYGLIEKDRAAYADKQVVARLLYTTADEPDLDHALLEGVWRPLEEVLRDLSRPGCKHDYEVKELK